MVFNGSAYAAANVIKFSYTETFQNNCVPQPESYTGDISGQVVFTSNPNGGYTGHVLLHGVATNDDGSNTRLVFDVNTNFQTQYVTDNVFVANNIQFDRYTATGRSTVPDNYYGRTGGRLVMVDGRLVVEDATFEIVCR
ncbi:MAG: hypothetical protein M3301_09945 [Chloroflexota bacterium]|nr:hypothetical protein [Chloroflexota bacterium]